MADPDEGGRKDAGPPAHADALWNDWDTPPRVQDTPELHLDGFDGPLDLLLDLAERERIDLSRLSVGDLVDQFVAAMSRFESHVSLERRADWMVLAARLILLRSRLFWPTTPASAEAARSEAERERGRLQNLQFVRSAAAWLDLRPQLGRDVFARPPAERDPRVASYMRLMAACLAVMEMEEVRGQPIALEQVYRPVSHLLFRVPAALARMRGMLAGMTEPRRLGDFLPNVPADTPRRNLLARSAVSSTLVAALELARNGELMLGENIAFETVSVTSSPTPHKHP